MTEFTQQALRQMDEAHSNPVIVGVGPAAGREESPAIRQFVAVANLAGLRHLAQLDLPAEERRNPSITEAQYNAIQRQISANGENGRYVIIFEGANAGNLRAVRAFSGSRSTHYIGDDRLNGNIDGNVTAIEFNRTLNLSRDGAPPQAMPDALVRRGLFINASRDFSPSSYSVENFLRRVREANFAHAGPHSAMQNALAQAADSLYQPVGSEDGGAVPTLAAAKPKSKGGRDA